MEKNLSEIPFDDIEVGRILTSGTYELTKELITRFAELLGYDDPVYHDEEYAGKTEFGKIIAPPGMVFIYSLKVGTDSNVAAPGSIRMGDKIEFFRPGLMGDVLTTTLKVSDKFIKKERKFVELLFETVNQNGEKIVDLEFTAIIP